MVNEPTNRIHEKTDSGQPEVVGAVSQQQPELKHRVSEEGFYKSLLANVTDPQARLMILNASSVR